ncbi:MAG: hypothetical protein KGD73_12220 [Candidatus Lokiarchaeota archaeon]|nr:hypothetical protein [Candidatus Lokiarchaeota archaeon]
MEKKIKILVLVSVILIILGPVVGLLLNKVVVVPNQPFVIQETSNTDIQDAYAYPFSLAKGQKLVVEFSVFTANVSATIKILGKGTFDQAFEATSNPGGITGLDLIYSQFAFGQSPSSQSSSATSRSISNEGYWYIEFAGDTTGDYLISIPGDYVVIVYGTNSFATNVYFNIEVKIDGPGEIVELLMILVGVGALVAIMLLGTAGYLKKTGRGLL